MSSVTGFCDVVDDVEVYALVERTLLPYAVMLPGVLWWLMLAGALYWTAATI